MLLAGYQAATRMPDPRDPLQPEQKPRRILETFTPRQQPRIARRRSCPLLPGEQCQPRAAFGAGRHAGPSGPVVALVLVRLEGELPADGSGQPVASARQAQNLAATRDDGV